MVMDIDVIRTLNQAIAATETMNGQGVDLDTVKTRLRIIREISDGLGVDVKIPSNRTLMIKRYLGDVNEIL